MLDRVEDQGIIYLCTSMSEYTLWLVEFVPVKRKEKKKRKKDKNYDKNKESHDSKSCLSYS